MAQSRREDNRAIVRAASGTSKAADYILGFLPDEGGATPTGVMAAIYDAGVNSSGRFHEQVPGILRMPPSEGRR